MSTRGCEMRGQRQIQEGARVGCGTAVAERAEPGSLSFLPELPLPGAKSIAELAMNRKYGRGGGYVTGLLFYLNVESLCPRQEWDEYNQHAATI